MYVNNESFCVVVNTLCMYSLRVSYCGPQHVTSGLTKEYNL